MLFIAHDLAVVQRLADRVVVLYRGELMQLADADSLLVSPLHPYPEMLLEAAPGLSKDDYVPRPPAMPASKAVEGIAARSPAAVPGRSAACAPIRDRRSRRRPVDSSVAPLRPANWHFAQLRRHRGPW